MILSKIKEAKKRGLKVGFTASTFDLLHAGHVIMLEECKNNCDFLIVGLLTDPTISRPCSKNKPIQSTLERWLQVQTLKHIDEVIPFDTEEDLEDILKILEPDIRFVGEDYSGKDFTGKELGIEIFYNKRKHRFSSTRVREQVIKNNK